MTYHRLTTGITGLDETIKGLALGDNVVWRVGDIADYRRFVKPFAQAAQAAGAHLVYIRFASHAPLLDATDGAETVVLQPHDGFEVFVAAIHRVIERAGRGAYYVFDCLSDLVVDWYSDQMLGNFFKLTCPYLYDLRTLTYFAILRNTHSSRAVDPIFSTTQLFLDVFNHQERIYVRPIKVQHRFAQTMDMLHVWEGERFDRVTRSDIISSILHEANLHRGLHATLDAGPWDRAFLAADATLERTRRDGRDDEALRPILRRLLRMILSRDPGMLALAERHVTVEDVLDIRQRMIGTGLVGGKAAGMLVARAILRSRDPAIAAHLEAHDSYYVGADVFYTYLVDNGVWWVRQKQRDPQTFLEGADQARQNILTGAFPPHILRQFDAMLDYFGQSPIIVRSSSLLEDNFGNAFAGKYESVFCVNQGSRDKRLADFITAVKTVYASTMSEKALTYRAHRGLLELDEQMALLVMRVSGSSHGNCYYPHMAGVGFSWNPYAWSEDIDPAAGVVRLVFGLGTRAVDRSDDDYTRVVALNAPHRRPEANFDEVRHYAQRRVDFLDLEANQLISGSFDEVFRRSPDVPTGLFISSGEVADGRPAAPVLTFDGVLSDTSLVADLRRALGLLQDSYGVPVDIEFTANFLPDRSYFFNLVQCRPLPVTMAGVDEELDAGRDGEAIITARGAVIGHSRIVPIDRFIYVTPSLYGHLPVAQRYEVARVLSRINHLPAAGTTMLLGPGRWGTSTPSLGIPVRFQEISRVSVLCEIVCMHEGLVPDVSLGTHFLNELIEENILYLALFPDRGANHLDEQFFRDAPNLLPALLPDDARWADLIRVVEPARAGLGSVILRANAREQRVICCWRHGETSKNP